MGRDKKDGVSEDISILGIIPARGGSKRLPGKNLKPLHGISLLERTIIQAKKALPVSIVTSDSNEIIKEALRCGIKALLRPADLATDTAKSADVVSHVVGNYPVFEWFCLLQPTSPLRSVEDITNCIALAVGSGKSVHSTHNGKPNGAVYVGRTRGFTGDFWSGISYEMPLDRSVDIDTLEDFERAERILGNQIRATPSGQVLHQMLHQQPAPE